MPEPSRTERIMGIDPGLQAMGYGIIDIRGRNAALVDYGAVKTNPRHPFSQRLNTLYEAVEELTRKYEPECMVYEKVIYCQNVSIALSLGQARGAVIVAAARLQIPMTEFSPTEIKSAIVGKGRANKEQVQKMVQILLSMPKLPEPDHAADALAAALTYMHSREANRLIEKALHR